VLGQMGGEKVQQKGSLIIRLRKAALKTWILTPNYSHSEGHHDRTASATGSAVTCWHCG
jgi:hypothetical protein